MKSIFRKIALPFLVMPTVVAPLAVISCTDESPDIKKDLETTDLGYVDDLSKATILQAFLDKNPKVNRTSSRCRIYGDSHKGLVEVGPGSYYKRASVKITYHSKLDFDENNQKDYQLTRENSSFIVSFLILDDSYDENLDPKISWVASASSFYQDLDNFIKLDYQINRTEKNYQVVVSLKDGITEPNQIGGELKFHYSLDQDSIYSDDVLLARINLTIEV